MDPSTWNFVYIITSIVSLILIILIVLIFYFKSYIKKFEAENLNSINFYLKELNETNKKSKEQWLVHVDDMSNVFKRLLDETHRINGEFFQKQEWRFNDHVEALHLNYSTYVEKVSKANTQFSSILVKLNECVQNYNHINATLVDNYKKLG